MIDMTERTHRVTLQLSNQCCYTSMHGRCPTSTFTSKQILPLRLIKSVVADLKDMGWGKDKSIAFHDFNEPAIDPRLYWLLEYVVDQLPGVKPMLCTNGWYMNQELAQEMFDIGLDRMWISAYTKPERVRLWQEFKDFSHHIKIRNARLCNLMHRKVMRHSTCNAPYQDLVIRASGNLGLCCLDYAETVVFGDLRLDSLKDILDREQEQMEKIHHCLQLGDKRDEKLSICLTCKGRRLIH